MDVVSFYDLQLLSCYFNILNALTNSSQVYSKRLVNGKTRKLFLWLQKTEMQWNCRHQHKLKPTTSFHFPNWIAIWECLSVRLRICRTFGELFKFRSKLIIRLGISQNHSLSLSIYELESIKHKIRHKSYLFTNVAPILERFSLISVVKENFCSNSTL